MNRYTLATFTLWMLIGLAAKTQTTIPVSSAGIGDIKINMSHDKVQKLLAAPIPLTKANKDNQDWDTVKVSYKGMALTIVFTWQYVEEGKGETRVYRISGAHPQLATRSGIMLGSDKFEVIKKLDGFSLEVYPNWQYDQEKDKKRYSVVTLSDGDNGSMLYMYFTDNKLTGFMVTVFEGC